MTVKVDTVALRRLPLYIRHHTHVRTIDRDFEWLVLQLESEVMGRKAAERTWSDTAHWPRDWWQAFKLRFFPRWLLNRFPVKYDSRVLRVRLEDWQTFPHAAFDPPPPGYLGDPVNFVILTGLGDSYWRPKGQ